MSKKVESLKSVRVRINQNASKETRKELKQADFDKLLKACQKQNEIIDLCAYANKSLTDCVNALIEARLCADVEHAVKRVRRHKHVDITNYINTRLARLFERANVNIQDAVQNSVTSE